MPDIDERDAIEANREQWREGRRALDTRRFELSRWAAQTLYAGYPRVAATDLLTRREWVRSGPVPLDEVRLRWCGTAPSATVRGTEPESAAVRPLRVDGSRYETYASAVGELARPRLFEDLPCYRLLGVDVEDGGVQLSFGPGSYFDTIDTCEAVAHELAEARRVDPAGTPDLPLRTLIGDPCGLSRRPVTVALSALTLRRSARGATFVLHRRDEAKVAHGGGLYQVMPVGVFQPTGPREVSRVNDFDLWRSLAREYSEEFLGEPEHRGEDGPLDYKRWPFYRAVTEAREAGAVTAHWLGLGVDPLSLVTDILVVVVFDDATYDDLLGDAVSINAEGQVAGHHRFDAEHVSRVMATYPLQAAGAAVIASAWQHRAVLLSAG
jgi:hypothetical protein